MKSFFSFAGLFIVSTGLAQDFAKARLEASPRHHEWVQIESDGRSIQSFVAYPESRDNVPAVIVIHENRGLTDWVRSFADQLAEKGYLAIAPDLLSDFDTEHRRTSDFSTSDAARTAIYALDANRIMDDLKRVHAYLDKLPSTNGRTAVVGFCWGGSQSFRFATQTDALSAAFVFYGSPPQDPADYGRISAPVYGFYGAQDQRINATIADTESAMRENGKTFDYAIYDGAGHAYMRQGEDPQSTPANKAARELSWIRLERILSQLR